MARRFEIKDAWLGRVVEEIVDPERVIVDPHHHLWNRSGSRYVLEDLWGDTGSGHNISKTVFIECRANYYKDGPEHLRPVGETVFVEEIAAASRAGGGSEIAGIVARADLEHPELDAVLDAHAVAGKGLFRGIRDAGANDPHRDALFIPGQERENLFASEAYRRGVARLGERGYSLDTWHFHHQNVAFRDLAATVPGTTMILDHFRTPLGVGPYADQREAIFAQWREDIAAIGACPNVYAKLGGLAMPDNGFGWDKRETPPTSDEFVAAQARYYHHTIQCFGPERCMFESNFPVDKLSLSYHVLWNGLKKIAAEYSEAEQELMFRGTATKVYKLD
jgi:L-fuconolactonase